MAMFLFWFIQTKKWARAEVINEEKGKVYRQCFWSTAGESIKVSAAIGLFRFAERSIFKNVTSDYFGKSGYNE